MSKLNIFLFVIAIFALLTVSFATDYKEINSTTAPTFKKINKNNYDVFIDGKNIFKLKFVNAINNSNYWMHCTDGYECELTVELDAKVAAKLKDGQIRGGWYGGSASASSAYFKKQELKYTNFTFKNGTVIESSYLETIKDYDLKNIKLLKNERVNVSIKFTRYELKEVDIYFVIFNRHFKEQSIWATGGTEYTYLINGTNYTIHVCTAECDINVTTQIENAAILMVAGGGSGGCYVGGGGGAGGMIYHPDNYTLPIGNYSILIGQGGVGVTCGATPTNGNTGSNTSFNGLLALGGGFGGGQPGGNGGSGGGGGHYTYPGGNGTAGQGFGGGQPTDGTGGGGGSSQNGTSVDSVYDGGDGGNGTEIDINGSATYYAGGGGGAAADLFGDIGVGGLGGGGDGDTSDGPVPQNGTNYLGGGGGGAWTVRKSGNGGVGVFILRYLTEDVVTVVLNSPIDEENFTTDTPSNTFDWNCTGDNSSYLANLTIAGILNASDIPTINNTNTTTAASFNTNGEFNWSVTCYNDTYTGNSVDNDFRIWYAPPNIAVNIQTNNSFTNSTQYNYNWTAWAYNTLGDSQDLNMSLDYSNGTAIATNNSVSIADDGIGIVYGDDELILESDAKNVTLVLTYTNATLAESTGSQNITIVKPGTCGGSGLISCISIIGDGCGFTTVNNCAVILK